MNLLQVDILSISTSSSFTGTAALNVGQIKTALPSGSSGDCLIRFDNNGLQSLPETIIVNASYATIAAAIPSYGTGLSYAASVLSINGIAIDETRNISVDSMMIAYPQGSYTLLLVLGPKKTDQYLIGTVFATFLTAVNALAPSGGGGHVIQDNGSDMPQRTNLDFVGFTVTDDSGDDATVITIATAGQVNSVSGTAPIVVDSTDPVNPIVTLPADSVTNATLAEMATKTYKGRTSALTGNPEDVPVATVITDLGVDLKAPIASPTFTGTVTIPTPFTLGGVSVTPTGTELNFVDGVTSGIQAQLDDKGTGNVSKVGTPVNNQVGVWTGDGTIEGDAALTFDTTTDTLATTLITATTVTAALVGNATTATNLATVDPSTLVNGAYVGPTVTKTAGENFVAGEVGYIKSDGKIGRGDADALATAGVKYIALATILNNASGLWGRSGIYYRNDALYGAMTVGSLIWLSTTVGAVQTTQPSGTGDVVQNLGVVELTNVICFEPNLAMGVIV